MFVVCEKVLKNHMEMLAMQATKKKYPQDDSRL